MKKTAGFAQKSGVLFTETEMELFTSLVAERHGLLCDSPQAGRLAAGVRGRMRARGISRVDTYLPLLEADPIEQQRLIDLVTNTLSRFFRNPAQLRALRECVLPAICAQRLSEPVRLWSAGCATGEEPYTLAMLLEDAAPAGGYLITATDISCRALDVARRGSYAEGRLAEIPAEFRDRFVERSSGRSRIIPEVQGRITFVHHTVTDPPVVTDQDIVSCRNVFTYLTERARRRAIAAIHQSLRPGGYLVIGNSESPAGLSSRFESICTPWARIYRAR